MVTKSHAVRGAESGNMSGAGTNRTNATSSPIGIGLLFLSNAGIAVGHGERALRRRAL
jgi:hypothetical protein